MVFENISFIKPDITFCEGFSDRNTAPLFRKKFIINNLGCAKLYVCGLGYAYYYINGKRVTEDIFTAPVSDYNKTLWYNEYDISHLLHHGENTIAVICGNGFYNETIPTGWKFHEASWRDNPKFILRLEVDGEIAVKSDDSWKCMPDGPVYFNQLRMGEFYDANIYGESWTCSDFDDSGWDYAKMDDTPPTGVFRKCLCEPVREVKIYKPVKITKINDTTCCYDFGQNMSGYARLKIKGNKGDEITIRYCECVGEDSRPAYYGMDKYYLESGFQTDKFICSGEEMVWSPRFAYHGFRYMEVSGVDYCDKLELSAVFVHQDIKRRTEFRCSDEYINKLFNCGIMSSYSNMFYMLTDCPTREKLGWANDAQSSCEQMLTNFEAEKLLTKWHQDIKDAMRENGELPGIIPTAGWGYHWGNGPVSDGILFEIPYRVYLHSGNSKLMTESFSFFERYLDYLDERKGENGLVEFGLDDWAAPGGIGRVEVGFINAVLTYSFLRITALSAKLSGNGKEKEYTKKADGLRQFIMERYIDNDGYCTINEQCSVAMLIYYDIYNDIIPLKQQLKKLMEESEYHLNCGMVGLRRLLHALSKCGLSEYALKLLEADGYPGYKVWMDGDATTLWEKWDVNINSDSKNHHMYSDFMSWIIKNFGGIRIDEEKCGEIEFIFAPEFINGIEFSELDYNTVVGNIKVKWQRENDSIRIILKKDKTVRVRYNGEYLEKELNEWSVKL